MSDPQSRKYHVVINNPITYGLTHEYIRDVLSAMSLQYWCLSDEIGEHGTLHTHVYFVSLSGGIRFSTVQRRFRNVAHIEPARGSSLENRNYILKNGEQYKDKKETSVIGSFEEWGTLPDDGHSNNTDLEELQKSIINGDSTKTILLSNPKLTLRSDKVDLARSALLSEESLSHIRPIEVDYFCGDQIQIANHIYSSTNPLEIYRWSSFDGSIRFDGYTFQPILLLHPYHGEIPFGMLVSSILSGYPYLLPCRFRNVPANYTKVVISSTLSPYELYSFQKCRISLFINLIKHFYICDGKNIKEVSLTDRKELND